MYGTWSDIELTPAEVLQRNFWFCAIDDPSSFAQRDRIGVDHILVESDYPHGDSTWPNTQAMLARDLAGLPERRIERITLAQRERAVRHPVPEAVQQDPNAF